MDTSLNIVKFELSGFPMDALDQEMLRELRAFADRESTTVEETISMILEWYVDCEARSGARNAKGNVIPFPRSQ